MSRSLNVRLSRRDALRLSAGAGVGLVASGLLAACSQPTPAAPTSGSAPAAGSAATTKPAPAGAPAATIAGGTLVFAQATGPSHLDPLGVAQNTPFMGYFYQMYDTLVFREASGTMSPRLASSWKTLNDTTWELKLRDGVKFHNGEPFDANAVKFSLEKVLNPETKSTLAARVPKLKGIEVVDPQTVRLLTNNPEPTMLMGLSLVPIVPPKYTTDSPDQAAKHPVGTGPFKFVSYSSGERMTMAANENYFLGRPQVDQLIFRVIPDDAARLAALRAGEVHVSMGLPMDAVEAVEKTPGLRVEQAFLQVSLIVEFDTLRSEPLKDRRVRQALNYAVDKEQINKTVLGGRFKPLSGQLLPDGLLGHNPNVKMFPYDVAKAKSLLAEAGYPNGLDLELNGRFGKYTADRETQLTVVDQLGKAGIRIKFNQIEPAVWSQLSAASKQGPMFYVGWYAFGDPAGQTVWFTPKATLGVYYDDPTFTRFHDEAASTLDENKRSELYQKAMQYMHDEAMALFLYQPPTFYPTTDKVMGLEPRDDELLFFHKVGLKA